MGRGAKNEADEAAVVAMRRAFDGLSIRGTVVIGEGERDEAPMLYIGERVGTFRPDGGGIGGLFIAAPDQGRGGDGGGLGHADHFEDEDAIQNRTGSNG